MRFYHTPFLVRYGNHCSNLAYSDFQAWAITYRGQCGFLVKTLFYTRTQSNRIAPTNFLGT